MLSKTGRLHAIDSFTRSRVRLRTRNTTTNRIIRHTRCAVTSEQCAPSTMCACFARLEEHPRRTTNIAAAGAPSGRDVVPRCWADLMSRVCARGSGMVWREPTFGTYTLAASRWATRWIHCCLHCSSWAPPCCGCCSGAFRRATLASRSMAMMAAGFLY